METLNPPPTPICSEEHRSDAVDHRPSTQTQNSPVGEDRTTTSAFEVPSRHVIMCQRSTREAMIRDEAACAAEEEWRICAGPQP